LDKPACAAASLARRAGGILRKFEAMSRKLFQCAKLLILLGLLLGGPAFAHSPFGSSTRVALGTNQLEICVSTGESLAGTLLKEFPPETREPLAPGVTYALPVPIAERLYAVSADRQPLAAERAGLRLSGADYEFTLIYPRPDGLLLDLRAVYLEAPEAEGSAPLVLFDENGQQFSSALLSKGQNTWMAGLPSTGNASATTQVPVAAAQPAPPTFWQFLTLGVEHILGGFDHLLFLGALLVGCYRLAPMLGVITSFTLAHSLTLALAALNVVALSSRVVEPLIAVSIICVGLENFRRGHSVRVRCGMAFGFGLIHGFGFAGALRETGLGSGGYALVKPLFSFNLGVELGQLAVAAVFLPILFGLRRHPQFERYGTPALSTVIILISGYWLVERTLLPGSR
jgi:hydrogenase/urease accessory protein HupE